MVSYKGIELLKFNLIIKLELEVLRDNVFDILDQAVQTDYLEFVDFRRFIYIFYFALAIRTAKALYS